MNASNYGLSWSGSANICLLRQKTFMPAERSFGLNPITLGQGRKNNDSMIKTITYLITAILLSLSVSQAQQPDDPPFVVFEKAIKDERAGFAGNKERLSTVFNAERQRLGDRFESELMKWLGSDFERHYRISFFLESESYLHGSKPLLHLSLLVKQQGLVLVQGKEDERSRGYAVGLNITAAILSHKLGFPGPE